MKLLLDRYISLTATEGIRGVGLARFGDFCNKIHLSSIFSIDTNGLMRIVGVEDSPGGRIVGLKMLGRVWAGYLTIEKIGIEYSSEYYVYYALLDIRN